MSVRRWNPIVLACVSACLLALFSDVLLRERVFFERDILIVWMAQVEAFVRAIVAASWPLWDPTVSFGHPLLANPNTQVYYPPTWLHLVMLPDRQYTVYVIAHCFLAALGAYALAMRFDLSREGALAGACLFIVSGPFLSLVNVWHHLASTAWMPWVVLAAHHALDAPTLSSAGLWGLAVAAQLLAGSPDVSVYTHLIVLAQILRRLTSRGPDAAPAGAMIRTTAIAYVFAAGLSAGQWLPTLDLLKESSRRALPMGGPMAWEMHPAAILQVIFPLSFESLPKLASESQPMTGLLNLWSPFMSSTYLGLVSLGLIAAAIAGPKRPHRRFLGGIGAMGLLLALGSHTPLYHLTALLIPPLRTLRYPSKALVVLALAWSLLAGMGFEALRGRLSRRRERAVAGVLAAAVALAWTSLVIAGQGIPGTPIALRIGSSGPSWSQVVSLNMRPLVVAAALGAAALALLVWRGRTPAPSAAALGLAIVAALDLIAANRAINTTTEKRFFRHRPQIVDIIPPKRGGEPGPRLYVWDYLLRVEGRGHPRAGAVASLIDVPTNLPPRLSLSLAMVGYLYPPSFGRWGYAGSYDRDLLGLYPRRLDDMNLALRALEDTPEYLRLLQLGGVDRVVALHAEGHYGLTPVATVQDLYRKPLRIFEVPDTLPRTYAVGCARAASGDAAYRLVLDPAFVPRREVVVPAGQSAACDPSFSGQSRIADFKPDRVTLDATLSAPGWVVLLDSHARGWNARVDGRAAEIVPANVLFRAVRVPAGTHRIEMVYRPAAVLWGAAISAAFAAAGLGFVTIRRAAGARRSTR